LILWTIQIVISSLFDNLNLLPAQSTCALADVDYTA